MKDLIKVTKTTLNGSDVNSVDAKEIYKYLGVKTAFTTWIQRTVDKYDFRDDIDFKSLSILKPSGQKENVVVVTLDMAKELCMVSNTNKGKEARKYFIEVEKQSLKPLSFEEMAKQTILLADKKIKELEHKIVVKDEIILAVADLNIKAGNVTIADFSKNLAIDGLGRNNMFAYLKGRGFLGVDTAPYQPYVERGYFVRKPTKEKHGGEIRYTTMLTPKGTVWLTKIINAEFDLD